MRFKNNVLLRSGFLFVVLASILFVLVFLLRGSFWFHEGETEVAKNVAEVNKEYRVIHVNGHELRVEIADTPEESTRGLSGHVPLGRDEGMLFLFTKNAIRPFWMKDMLFDLDMLWIRDEKVVEIARYMPAPGKHGIPTTYRPSEEANMVLEINAGRAEELGIEIGTEMEDLPVY